VKTENEFFEGKLTENQAKLENETDEAEKEKI
jgi:hypothetical protein